VIDILYFPHRGFFGFADSIHRKTTHFVGYNMLKFDFPFLERRAEAHGLHNEKAILKLPTNSVDWWGWLCASQL